MKQYSKLFAFFLAPTTVLFSASAFAHAGIGEPHGILSGLGHPFSGLDHLAAMLAVGLWAAQLGGRALWLVPLSFVSVTAMSGLLAMFAVPIPFIEGGITLSLLVLGLLIAAAIRLPVLASAAIVCVFAVFHGYAHGAEMPQNADTLAYAAGFILATALLHLSGIGMSALAKKHSQAQWLRFAGVAVILCGCISWSGNSIL